MKKRTEWTKSPVAAMALALFTLIACGGGASAPVAGGGGGAGLRTVSIPLRLASLYDLTAFVDSQGTYTNVYHIRIGAYGGAPTTSGYSWSVTLGAGLPSTITVDPMTGLVGGTLPSTFVPGPPGVQAGPGTYAYDMT